MARAAKTSATTLTGGSRITGGPREALKKEYAKRYAAGESLRAIVAESGRSYGFVHNLLVESNTPLRGRGGATRGPAKSTTTKASAKKATTKKSTAKKATATGTPARKPPAKRSAAATSAPRKTATTKTTAKKATARKAAQRS